VSITSSMMCFISGLDNKLDNSCFISGEERISIIACFTSGECIISATISGESQSDVWGKIEHPDKIIRDSHPIKIFLFNLFISVYDVFLTVIISNNRRLIPDERFIRGRCLSNMDKRKGLHYTW